MSKKYFTVQEANALIPELMEEIPLLQTLYSCLSQKFPDVRNAWKNAQLNGGSVEGATYLGLALQYTSKIKQLESRGCIIKGIENGLVDFLALRDGREVYLCWKHPETEIRFWHDLDTGFAGRQPI